MINFLNPFLRFSMLSPEDQAWLNTHYPISQVIYIRSVGRIYIVQDEHRLRLSQLVVDLKEKDYLFYSSLDGICILRLGPIGC